MKLTQKIFGLKGISPFDRLGYSELVAIAEVTRVKRFAPGERVIPSGHVLQRLFAVIEGQIVRDGGAPVPAVFGVRSLLDEMPIAADLTAGPGGAVCLLISKGHFYRILNEFPEFTLGFLTRNDSEDLEHQEGGQS